MHDSRSLSKKKIATIIAMREKSEVKTVKSPTKKNVGFNKVSMPLINQIQQAAKMKDA
jgi:hypothetical protein